MGTAIVCKIYAKISHNEEFKGNLAVFLLAYGFVDVFVRADCGKMDSYADREDPFVGYRVDYGTIGSGCVLRALFECGSADDAYRMMVQPDYPGCGYLAADTEMTAFPEYWMINGQSKNHRAFADVVACMFRYLGGIRPVVHRPGRDYVEIRPSYPKGLADFAAEYDGFRVAWKRCGDEIHVDIAVPDGKAADFYGIDGVRRALSAGRHRLVESGR